MKTLSVTEGRQNLGAWLKRALQGEDVGFLVDGRVVALRPVEVHSDDFVLQEYGVSEKQAERAYKAVKTAVRQARAAGQTKPFYPPKEVVPIAGHPPFAGITCNS